MVVRECCKDNNESLWGIAKFDPLPPWNPLTDCHQNLHRWCWGYLPPCKIYSDQIRGFVCMHAWLPAPKCLFGYFLGSSNHPQPRRPHGFWRKIRQKMQFCTSMCLFGVTEPKFSIYTLFPPQPPFWGPIFTARCSYASVVLGVIILSVCPSVCHTRALWLIQRTYRRYFYTRWQGNPSSFLMPKMSAKFQRVSPNGGAK